jgi:hypothetical protein
MRESVKRTTVVNWWCMPIIPVARKLRKEDCKFKSSLGKLVRSASKKMVVSQGESWRILIVWGRKSSGEGNAI